MFLKSFGRFFLNLICPPVCPLCHQSVEEAHCLCPECYRKLRFITKPYCQICGRPFEYQGLNNLVCGACARKKPTYSMARSVLEYDSASKQLILSFKHGNRTELLPLLTRFMRQADPKLFEDVDLIIPVPLHWSRLIKRGYNQAGLLGKSLGKCLKIPYSPDILKRIRQTESQGHKTAAARQRNVKKAFRVIRQSQVKGKVILLIDDVMTTGATLNECAGTLKKAGAKEVKVIALYRVITL